MFSGAVVIIQENGEYSFFITALRIEESNACSQYPKYQSVSIITISSGRDPNASPLIRRLQRLQTPVTVLFITHFFSSAEATKGAGTKARTRAPQEQAERSNPEPQIHQRSDLVGQPHKGREEILKV